MSRRTFWVERLCPVRNRWERITGACDSSRRYCEGWMHALDGFYPHPDYRLVAAHGLNGERDVLEECPARAAVSVAP